MYKNILITGGAGFIGSHVLRLFVNKYPEVQFVNLDLLTYAGNLENISDLEDKPNYVFEKGDIRDVAFLNNLFDKYQFDGVIHLAAESHVDRSISNPLAFVETNVIGTVNLLNAAKRIWQEDFENKLFYHISTDEVYGSLGKTGLFTEETPYDPHSPYSASKAASDHFVRSYHDTYGMPTVISNCSNNYGPNQFPEKLIPLMIINAMNNKKLPVYGDGLNIRDWIYVLDHNKAIEVVWEKGKVGEVYNIGANNEIPNIEIVKLILDKLGKDESLIEYVQDRLGHDRRYAIDSSKIQAELGWSPKYDFTNAMEKTINWYLNNKDWWERIISGEYKEYYRLQYDK